MHASPPSGILSPDFLLFSFQVQRQPEPEVDIPSVGAVPVAVRTTQAIARAKPASDREFLAISGVGLKRHAQYGQAFIDCVRDHLGE